MKNLFRLTLAIILFGNILAKAQTNDLIVREKGGNENAYSISNIRKLSFSSGNLIVTLKTGNPYIYATSNIDRLFFKQAVTGIAAEETEEKTMSLYPNPVADVLRLRLIGGTTQVQIQDMQGKVWMSKTAEGNEATLNMVELPAGLYTCTLKSENATNSIKLLKQ
jgi:hypothetical protein